MTFPGLNKDVDNRYIKLVMALLLVPLPFELAFGFIKNEPYSWDRALIIAVAVVGLLLIVQLFRRDREKPWPWQGVAGAYAIALGLAITAFGLFIAFWDFSRPGDTREVIQWPPWVETMVTALAPSLGVGLVVVGVYLVVSQHRRVKAELEMELPRGLGTPEIALAGQWAVATWQAEGSTRRSGQESLVDICRKQLHVDDLHFLALFNSNGEPNFYVDVLGNPQVRAKASGDMAARRVNYIRHGRHLRYLAKRLDVRMADLDAGILVRVVADVERGALYYYDLHADGFVVGVTLDQQQVDPTDWKMSDVSNALLRAMGRTEMEDFYRFCKHCKRTNRGQHQHPAANGGNSNGDTGNVRQIRPKEAG